MRGSIGTVGMKIFFSLATIFAAAMILPASAQEPVVDAGGTNMASRELVLPQGKAAIVDLPRAAVDVLISDPEVVEAVVRTPRRIYVLGRKAGTANAFFFDRQNNQILNLEIRIEPDVAAVREIITKVMPDSRINVESLHGSVVLHGRVDTAQEAQQAEDLATRLVGGSNVVSMLSIREPAQVMLRVRVVEMERRLIRQLGIDLNGVARINDSALTFAANNSFAVSGSALGGLNGTVNTRGIGNIEDLDFTFDMFEQNGLVKVLAEPNLVAMTGHSAKFLAGGEFPVPEASQNGVPSVTFKEFGVKLDFRPIVYSKGRIQVQLRTEVSDVSFATGVSFGSQQATDENGNIISTDGYVVPGTTARSAETTVELPSGGSFAIAGLLQENITEFVDGVPGLKETPVFGALFRSQEFQNNQTELVIIATPYLVEPTEMDKLTDPARGHVSASAVQSALLGRLESAYGVKGSGVYHKGLQGPLGFILD